MHIEQFDKPGLEEEGGEEEGEREKQEKLYKKLLRT
jgi:hypothetical protein